MENIPGFDPSKEAACEHFSEAFLQSNGPESQLVLTLSDIWTTAMFNLQIANNILPKEAEPKLLTDGVAVSHIVDLYRLTRIPSNSHSFRNHSDFKILEKYREFLMNPLVLVHTISGKNTLRREN